MATQIKIKFRPENFAKKLSAVDLKRDMSKAIAIIVKDLEAEGKEQTTRMIYQTPESPNYRRTGWLRKSITSSSNGLMGRVDALAFYSEYVHEGTRRMIARPFFTEAVNVYKPKLEKETGRAIEISIEKQLK